MTIENNPTAREARTKIIAIIMSVKKNPDMGWSITISKSCGYKEKAIDKLEHYGKLLFVFKESKMYRIFNQGQQTPKEPMAFKGFDKDNAYVFQAPTSGIVHRLSSRAFRDVVEGIQEHLQK